MNKKLNNYLFLMNKVINRTYFHKNAQALDTVYFDSSKIRKIRLVLPKLSLKGTKTEMRSKKKLGWDYQRRRDVVYHYEPHRKSLKKAWVPKGRLAPHSLESAALARKFCTHTVFFNTKEITSQRQCKTSDTTKTAEPNTRKTVFAEVNSF